MPRLPSPRTMARMQVGVALALGALGVVFLGAAPLVALACGMTAGFLIATA